MIGWNDPKKILEICMYVVIFSVLKKYLLWIIYYAIHHSSKTSRKTLKNIRSIWWRKKIYTICICEKNYVILFLVEHFWSSVKSWSSVPIILGRFLQNEPVSYAIMAEASTPIFIFLIRSSTSVWPQQLYSWLPTIAQWWIPQPQILKLIAYG